jgi:hypothetical protein
MKLDLTDNEVDALCKIIMARHVITCQTEFLGITFSIKLGRTFVGISTESWEVHDQGSRYMLRRGLEDEFRRDIMMVRVAG